VSSCSDAAYCAGSYASTYVTAVGASLRNTIGEAAKKRDRDAVTARAASSCSVQMAERAAIEGAVRGTREVRHVESKLRIYP
jgi:hypothetical protein